MQYILNQPFLFTKMIVHVPVRLKEINQRCNDEYSRI